MRIACGLPLLLICVTACSDTGARDGSKGSVALAAEQRAADISAGVDLARHFNGGCTAGCSGHRAGYIWAMRRGLRDNGMCMNSSSSFRDGCQLAVEDSAILTR